MLVLILTFVRFFASITQWLLRPWAFVPVACSCAEPKSHFHHRYTSQQWTPGALSAHPSKCSCNPVEKRLFNMLKQKKAIFYLFFNIIYLFFICEFLSQSWRNRTKIAFSFQYLHKKNNSIFSGNSTNLEKLKQNEHQVLSCTQKKCQIKTLAQLGSWILRLYLSVGSQSAAQTIVGQKKYEPKIPISYFQPPV